MRKILFIAFLLFSAFAKATPIDSAKVSELVKHGQKEFCHILDINDEAILENKKENMQFIIELLPANYISNVAYGERYGQTFSDNTIKDSLNARIRRIYIDYGIELYIVLINSLDVLVNTPLPSGATSTQFFQNKLYDENSNLASLKALHNSITDQIINQSLSGQNRDCIVFSQAEYCGTFFANGKKGCWEFSVLSKHNGATLSYPQIDKLEEYFKTRLLSNHASLSGGINGQLVTTVDEFRESAKYIQLKDQIRQAFHPLQLDAIFAQFDEDIDYKNLSIGDRKHALSVYTGFPMTDGWFGNFSQEKHAIKIIKYTPPDDVHDLLYILEQPNSLKTNSAYHGDPSDDALIKKLIDHTDDGGLPFTDDNYSLLVQVITKLVVSSSQETEEHLPQNDADWLNRRIYWDDSYLFTHAPIGTHSYDVSLHADGKISLQKQVVDHLDVDYNNAAATAHYTAHWDNTYDPVELHPFDLVFFQNRSNLGMLAVAGATQNSIFLAPAIFLKYANDKTFNANAIRTGAIALDVLAIATGPGAILGAIESCRLGLAAFEVVQFLGSAGNLVAQGITDPDLQSVVDKYNMIIGIWGITRIVTSGTKYTVNYFTEASSGGLHSIPASTAQEFENAFHQAGTKIEELSPELKGKVKRMDEYLEGKVGVVGTSFDVNNISSQLTTPLNKAFFWSGKTNGIGGAEKALEIANNKGGITLEGLIAQNHISVPDWNINDPISLQAWEDVSEEFAKKAKGEIHAVIGQELRPGSIWETKELPSLKANPNVLKIIKIDPETLVETTIFER